MFMKIISIALIMKLFRWKRRWFCYICKVNLRLNVFRSELRNIIEQVWIRIQVQNKSIYVRNIHRPSGFNCKKRWGYFEDLLIDFHVDCYPVLCFSDFTLNILVFESKYVTHSNSLLISVAFTQMVTESTKI